MTELYEAHITVDREYADRVERVSSVTSWKFSKIDGDPVMGSGPRCYLTAHDTSSKALLDRIYSISAALKDLGIPVQRQKIEQILFDTATNRNDIGEPLKR